ncbi:hypothetical protein ACIOJD_30890 [Streptomyces sp. NPDC088116]
MTSLRVTLAGIRDGIFEQLNALLHRLAREDEGRARSRPAS